METLTLNAPEVFPPPAALPTTSTWRVASLLLDWDGALIVVMVRGANSELRECRYEGATATNLMKTLNTANLSVKSLHKRVLEKLVTDGKLPAGNVTGLPDV